MNIFVLDEDPSRAGEIQVECAGRFSYKLILESAQMLSTAVRLNGYIGDEVYKIAYSNHPCTVWTRENKTNAKWLIDMSLTMCSLYTLATGKIYASEKVIRKCEQLLYLLPEGSLTAPALAVNSTPEGIQAKKDYLDLMGTWEGAVKVYRDFYFKGKDYLTCCALPND
jgi:hypothetical protein